MPDWLTSLAAAESEMALSDFALRIAMALLFGGLIAVVYRLSHGRDNREATSFCTTLVLLCGLIAMVTIVVGGSVAKAFSLVGALSIVRFRTVVEDTRDTAFVIFSVIVGMAVGSGHILFPAVGMVGVGTTACALSRLHAWRSPNVWMQLTVRMGLGRNPTDLLQSTLAVACQRASLRGAATAKNGAAIEYSYDVQLASAESLSPLVAQLSQLEGVLSVELKQK